MVGIVSLYVVFWNLVAPVITSGETTWGYRKLELFRKLENKLWYNNCLLSRMQAPMSEELRIAGD